MASTTIASSVPSAGAATLDVPYTDDFELNGLGDFPAWSRLAAAPMTPIAGDDGVPDDDQGRSESYHTWFKCLWSPTGIYFLIDCADRRLSATDLGDQGHLWTQDVVEIFLWPSEDLPVYLEAQVSPLGRELVILVPNVNGWFLGWSPWQYEGPRRMRKAVSVRGGPAQPMAEITGWRVELFIPTDLFRPLANTELAPGVSWRGNVYRIDHDAHPGGKRRWGWEPRVGCDFHDFRRFGTLRFT